MISLLAIFVIKSHMDEAPKKGISLTEYESPASYSDARE